MPEPVVAFSTPSEAFSAEDEGLGLNLESELELDSASEAASIDWVDVGGGGATGTGAGAAAAAEAAAAAAGAEVVAAAARDGSGGEPSVGRPEKPEPEPAPEAAEAEGAPPPAAQRQRLLGPPLGGRYCFDVEQAYDRAYAAVVGAALGDALGLPAEGLGPEAVAERFPDGLSLPHRGAAAAPSPRGHPPGDWTDATDFTVLTMRSLSAYFREEVDDPALAFAAGALRWRREGFHELGDTKGVDPEGVVARAMAHHAFSGDPARAAAEVTGPRAGNGALLRTAPCAFTTAPADWADLFCETTHADRRSLAATRTLTLLLEALVRCPPGAAPVPALLLAAAARGREAMPAATMAPARSEFMRRLTQSRTLTELRLGERDEPAHAFKALSCAAWAFRQLLRRPPGGRALPEFFKRTLRAVVAQGGDASANGAVAGAVLGAALGEAALPRDWVAALPHHEWLSNEIEAFLVAAVPTWVLEP